MPMLLPVLSSLASIVESMRVAGGVPAPLALKMRAVKDGIQSGATEAVPFALSPVQLKPGSDTELVAAAEERLHELAALWEYCMTLCSRLGEKHLARKWSPKFLRWEVGQARHYNHGMLLFSTVTVALAISTMGMLWIEMGWADGAGAVALGDLVLFLRGAR
ncbi:FUSC family protein [Cupriavidus necator]